MKLEVIYKWAVIGCFLSSCLIATFVQYNVERTGNNGLYLWLLVTLLNSPSLWAKAAKNVLE